MTPLATQAERRGGYGITMLGYSIFDVYQLHKSVGETLFFAVALHRAARAMAPTPVHHGLSQAEQIVSRLVYMVLCILMFAVPLTGWMLASSSNLGLPTVVFVLFHLPHLVGPSKTAEQVWSWLHVLGSFAFATLVVMHVVAVFKHHFWDQDGILASMLPARIHSKRRKIP